MIAIGQKELLHSKNKKEIPNAKLYVKYIINISTFHEILADIKQNENRTDFLFYKQTLSINISNLLLSKYLYLLIIVIISKIFSKFSHSDFLVLNRLSNYHTGSAILVRKLIRFDYIEGCFLVYIIKKYHIECTIY